MENRDTIPVDEFEYEEDYDLNEEEVQFEEYDGQDEYIDSEIRDKRLKKRKRKRRRRRRFLPTLLVLILAAIGLFVFAK